MAYLLKKEDFPLFIRLLNKSYDVYAPTQSKGMVVFSKIESHEGIVLDRNSYYPPKKYFLPQDGLLFKYNRKRSLLGGEKETLEPRLPPHKKVIFGMRMCDVSAIAKMDKLFLSDTKDTFYEEARNNIFIIAKKCTSEENENCFCSSFEIKDEGYDLYFEPDTEGFIVDVKTEKGKSLIDKKFFKSSVREVSKDLPQCSLQLPPAYGLQADWKKHSESCISCSACNIVCPTCMCFDIKDVPELGMRQGKRRRQWDYCQSQDFTKIDGKPVREQRHERFRHRLYCKFDYTKKSMGEITCTGCGRCITVCPTKVSHVPDILRDGNG